MAEAAQWQSNHCSVGIKALCSQDTQVYYKVYSGQISDKNLSVLGNQIF